MILILMLSTLFSYRLVIRVIGDYHFPYYLLLGFFIICGIMMFMSYKGEIFTFRKIIIKSVLTFVLLLCSNLIIQYLTLNYLPDREEILQVLVVLSIISGALLEMFREDALLLETYQFACNKGIFKSVNEKINLFTEGNNSDAEQSNSKSYKGKGKAIDSEQSPSQGDKGKGRATNTDQSHSKSNKGKGRAIDSEQSGTKPYEGKGKGRAINPEQSGYESGKASSSRQNTHRITKQRNTDSNTPNNPYHIKRMKNIIAEKIRDYHENTTGSESDLRYYDIIMSMKKSLDKYDDNMTIDKDKWLRVLKTTKTRKDYVFYDKIYEFSEIESSRESSPQLVEKAPSPKPIPKDSTLNTSLPRIEPTFEPFAPLKKPTARPSFIPYHTYNPNFPYTGYPYAGYPYGDYSHVTNPYPNYPYPGYPYPGHPHVPQQGYPPVPPVEYPPVASGSQNPIGPSFAGSGSQNPTAPPADNVPAITPTYSTTTATATNDAPVVTPTNNASGPPATNTGVAPANNPPLPANNSRANWERFRRWLGPYPGSNNR